MKTTHKAWFAVICFTVFSNSSVLANVVYEDLTLQEAITTALESNATKRVSLQAAAIAESQYQEALSARWPTVSFEASAMRSDEDLTTTAPQINAPLGSFGATLGAALGPLLPPGTSIPTTITVPEQKIKLMDRDTATATIKFMMPLYTGGKIDSIINQANYGKAIAQEEYRRTSLQVVRDVKRYYYAVKLTQGLTEVSQGAIATLEHTRDLTKRIYESGVGSFNKLDYLKTEMALNYAKSLKVEFASKEKSATAALIHVMGISWGSEINIADDDFPEKSNQMALDNLISQAHQYNPDMGVLKLAIKVADEQVREAKSAYYPQVALTGNIRHIENSYDAGIVNDDNKDSWTIGVVLQMPIFDFGKTSNNVNTAKLQRRKMAETEVLVEQGLAAQIKHLFIGLNAANEQKKISETTVNFSRDYERLTSQAYRIGASKPEDMIQASIYNAVTKGGLLRAKHDRANSMAEIEYFIGSQVN